MLVSMFVYIVLKYVRAVFVPVIRLVSDAFVQRHRTLISRLR